MSTFGNFTVTRASSKRVLGSAGTLVTYGNNEPAFEFNADGTYRGLSVEPGATNLLLRSEEFSNASWAKSDVTVTANSVTAPDGTLTADTITEGSAGTASTGQDVTVSSGATATFSMFFRYSTVQWLRIRFSNGSDAVNAWVDIQNGVAGTISGAGTGVVGSVRVENYGNGWYRCSVSGSIPAVTSYTYSFFSAGGNGSFARVSGSAYRVWGAGGETGSVATSYIPTVASTANRSTDEVTLTGASSLIGQTEGTIYCEIDTRITGTFPAFKRIINLQSDNNNYIRILKLSTDAIEFSVGNAGSNQCVIATATGRSGVFKLAASYKLDDFVFYANGAQVGTDASGLLPVGTISDIGIGCRNNGGSADGQFGDNIRSVALYKTRLTNSQLQALTA